MWNVQEQLWDLQTQVMLVSCRAQSYHTMGADLQGTGQHCIVIDCTLLTFLVCQFATNLYFQLHFQRCWCGARGSGLICSRLGALCPAGNFRCGGKRTGHPTAAFK